ncbi:MAG: hypothetical protein AB7G47_20350 [Mycolicibacterium sp.]|uniref:cysteine dioxygenase family protein n=1 Tax=Mycolicibacterium sp. TaxID=2320850 RepID=UPI003D0D5291
MNNLNRLRDYIVDMTQLVDAAGADEARLFRDGEPLLSRLVAQDDWLPEAFATSSPETYRQYLLWCDPRERFSVVSFVWGPGQKTSIHDHTVWGMVGMLRGRERYEEYDRPEPGQAMHKTGEYHAHPGQVAKVSPSIGDIHLVANDVEDGPSISIHVYGANVGSLVRHSFDDSDGRATPFVSGYSSAVIPNLWDRSAEVRASLH